MTTSELPFMLVFDYVKRFYMVLWWQERFIVLDELGLSRCRNEGSLSNDGDMGMRRWGFLT